MSSLRSPVLHSYSEDRSAGRRRREGNTRTLRCDTNSQTSRQGPPEMERKRRDARGRERSPRVCISLAAPPDPSAPEQRARASGRAQALQPIRPSLCERCLSGLAGYARSRTGALACKRRGSVGLADYAHSRTEKEKLPRGAGMQKERLGRASALVSGPREESAPDLDRRAGRTRGA